MLWGFRVGEVNNPFLAMCIWYQWTQATPETMLYLTILCLACVVILPILTSRNKPCSDANMNYLKWYFIVLNSPKACSLWDGQLFWASPQTLKKKEQWKRILECKIHHTMRLDSIDLTLIKFKNVLNCDFCVHWKVRWSCSALWFC